MAPDKTRPSGVSELEAIKEELQKSEERYRTTFEYTGTAMMVVEEDTSVSMWNHRLEEVTGYNQADAILGRKWTEFVADEDLPRLMEYHIQRRKDPSSVPSEYEYHLKHKSGEMRDILMNVGLIPGTKRTLISLIDITQRKQMENALRESEQRYRDLFENANDIIYIHDFDGKFIDANAAALRTFGYSRDDLLRLNIKDLVSPEWLPIAYQNMQAKQSVNDRSEPYVLLTFKKDKTPVWVEVSTRIIVEKEKPACIQGIARDFTERKHAEDKLRESERRFKETAELLPCIVCETDLDFHFIYTNKLGLSQFGYSQVDIDQGLTILQVLHPQEHERVKQNIKRIVEVGFVGPQEYRMVHRDGTVVDYLLTSSPILTDGKLSGLRTCLFDITERKATELKLRNSEERFRGIYNHSPIGIALFNTTGMCEDMNQSFRKMFDIKDRIPGRDKLFTMTPEQKHQLERGVNVEFEAAGSDSSNAGTASRWLDWHLTPLGTADGGPTSLLVQVQDITEKKRAQDSVLNQARSAVENAHRMVDNLKKEMTQTFSFSNMVSRNPEMRALFDLLPEMAHTATTVLITGESGTGKELIARSLHELSPRKNKPFVAINCSALPDTLLESELFGYKAGAFTDAKKDKPGKFAQAEGGTIFLDEIGDISPAMQAKLLRILQERTYEPLGGNVSLKADVRFITATNRDLSAMVKEGKFREDLFYRIKVLQVKLPPLRDRRSDIPLLAQYFIERFNQRYNKQIAGLSQESLDVLVAHNFPGNIRELENVIEHAFVFCKGTHIEPSHLPSEVRTAASGSTLSMSTKVDGFDDLERMYLKSVLEEVGGSKIKAAEKLGIHKATLFRKLKRLGLKVEKGESGED